MDKVGHGTRNIGQRNGVAKLVVEEVKEIRRSYVAGEYSLSQLAGKYGVVIGTIHPIIQRRTWKDV